MAKKKINENLDLEDYIQVVQSIVDGYYDVQNARYEPHWGMLNAFTIYHDVCYVEKEEDKINGDTNKLKEALKDESFVYSFNTCIKSEYGCRLNFSCAYKQAMDIVEHRKTSLFSLLDYASMLFGGLVESFGNINENKELLNKVVELINGVKSGELAQGIVNDYLNTDEYKERTQAILSQKKDKEQEDVNKTTVLSTDEKFGA